MNECDFQQPFSQAKTYTSKITCNKLLEGIHLGTYFGTAICDVHVPQHLKTKFSEMRPIFKNVEVTNQYIEPYMSSVCDKLNEFKTPRRSTLLFQCYMKLGLVIDNLTAQHSYATS